MPNEKLFPSSWLKTVNTQCGRPLAPLKLRPIESTNMASRYTPAGKKTIQPSIQNLCRTSRYWWQILSKISLSQHRHGPRVLSRDCTLKYPNHNVKPPLWRPSILSYTSSTKTSSYDQQKVMQTKRTWLHPKRWITCQAWHSLGTGREAGDTSLSLPLQAFIIHACRRTFNFFGN